MPAGLPPLPYSPSSDACGTSRTTAAAEGGGEPFPGDVTLTLALAGAEDADEDAAFLGKAGAVGAQVRLQACSGVGLVAKASAART